MTDQARRYIQIPGKNSVHDLEKASYSCFNLLGSLELFPTLAILIPTLLNTGKHFQLPVFSLCSGLGRVSDVLVAFAWVVAVLILLVQVEPHTLLVFTCALGYS